MKKLASDGVHLVSREGLNHLHLAVTELGIKRCWFHNGGGGRFPHYDIPKKMRAKFFENWPHVERVSSREIVAILKGRGGQP